jgi:hypothetical protein
MRIKRGDVSDTVEPLILVFPEALSSAPSAPVPLDPRSLPPKIGSFVQGVSVHEVVVSVVSSIGLPHGCRRPGRVIAVTAGDNTSCPEHLAAELITSTLAVVMAMVGHAAPAQSSITQWSSRAAGVCVAADGHQSPRRRGGRMVRMA